jgi:ATP-binding cassette, subfamily B, bacterial MsbA
MSVGKRLRRYVKPHLARFVWAAAAMAAVSFCNGVSVLILKPIVDRILIEKDLHMLWLAVAGVPLLIAAKSIVSYLQNYLMSWIGQRVTQQLREDLFRHLHVLPLEFYGGGKASDVLSRVTSDLTLVQSALTTLPVYLVRDSLTVLFLVGSLFWLDWRFAAVAVLGSPLSLAALWVLSAKMRESSRQASIATERLHHRFSESVQGMMTVKAFNYEDGAIEKFQEENESFFLPMMRYLRAVALMTPAMELGSSLLAALILWFGGREVILGHITPGAFFAFLGAFFAAYAPIKNLARINAEVQRAWASAERLFQLLDEKPAVPKKRKPAFEGLKKLVRFEKVGFKYSGSKSWALRGLDLEIPKGARVAFVGPSGCGKTTAAKLLLRLHDPEEGRLLFDGKDARELDASSLRARIGLVDAESSMFHDTVLQNVSLGRKVVTLSEVERACEAVGAAGFIAALPEGYRTLLGDWGFSLSSGQRQLLALARVLLKDPELVILDEATAHLDPQSEREVLAALETVLKGRTVVTVSHRLAPVSRADRIYVLSDGRVAESGTHAELMGAGGLYRRLFELQSAQRPAEEAA